MYKKLLSRLKREYIDPADYCELYSIERRTVNGEVVLFFEASAKRQVKMVLMNEGWEELKTLFEGESKIGGNKVKFDSTAFENGSYFYGLITDNQNIRKKIIIENPV